MSKLFVNILPFFLLCFLLGGCNPSVNQQQGGIEVEDMLGRKVIVPSQIERVVGIRAGVLRLLTYMDASDMVIGIEEGESRGQRTYLAAYPELLQLPLIGPLMGGDAELILNARPDIIFTAYSTVDEVDALQKKTGVPVVALECPEMGITARDTLYASLRLIGKVLHKEERADSLVAYIQSSINELNARTVGIPEQKKLKAYVGGISYSGIKDIASTQPYYPPFIFTNTLNVTSAIDKRLVSHVKGTYIDKEQLLLWNPDVIFIDESGLGLVNNDLKAGGALYNGLSAVQNNRIYTLLPYNNYAVNYELVLINSWFVGKTLYPDAFADIDMESKANEILTAFFDKPIWNQLATENSFRQINKEEFK